MQLNTALLNRGISGHTSRQLGSYLTRLKEKLQGPPNISYSELREWCENHAAIPEEDDDVYVLHHEVAETRGVRVIMSTRRLLVNGSKSEVVHVDATYKLTWNGFPVLISGVTDGGRQFFPTVFAVMQGETTEDYTVLLQTMKDAVEEASGLAFRLRTVMGDCADSISAAASQVFPDARRGYCWFHVKKALETQL